jgi:hypothetical protein
LAKKFVADKFAVSGTAGCKCKGCEELKAGVVYKLDFFIIVKLISSLVPTVCPPISPTSYLVMNFAVPNFSPSATSRIFFVKTNVLDVGSIHAMCVFIKKII